MTEKKCAKCGEWKPARPEYFYAHIGHSDGFSSYCIPCGIKVSAEWNTKKKKLKVKKDRELLGKRTKQDGDKQCTGPCGEWKPANTEHFYSHPDTNDRLQSVCKLCNNKASSRSKSKRGRYYTKTYLI